MNEETFERDQRRELRRGALQALSAFYGRELDTAGFDTIARYCGLSLTRENTRRVGVAIQMNIDAGYIERVSKKRDALDRDPEVVFRLTGKGMQWINGDIEDASIAL